MRPQHLVLLLVGERRSAVRRPVPWGTPSWYRSSSYARAIRGKAGSAAAPAARCKNCLRWGSFVMMSPSQASSHNARTNAQSVFDEGGMPADSTSAAHCNDRERHVPLAAWVRCYISFASWRKGPRGRFLLQRMSPLMARLCRHQHPPGTAAIGG